MIITENILDEQVPKEMMPTRLDSAMNLYTNVIIMAKRELSYIILILILGIVFILFMN